MTRQVPGRCWLSNRPVAPMDGETDKMNSINGKNKIPNGWVATTIGDVFDFQYGKSLPRKKRNPEGNYPVYGSNGRVGSHDQYLVHGPVIIIGRKGGVGEVSICKENCWPIDTTYYVIPPNGVDINFAYFLLKYANLRKLDTSTAIPGLNRNEAYKIKIPLPPLPEQHRIVAKIERLFLKLDKAVAELKKAKEKLELYRQSLLKAAFEGRLTEKWRKEHADELESAEELLARIKAERGKRYQQQLEEWKQAVKEWEAQGKPGKKPKKPHKPKELPPLIEEELAELPELPEGWVYIRLSYLGELSRGKSKHRPRNDPALFGGAYPFIQTGDIKANKVITSYSKTYNDYGLRQSKLWPKGTLCITIAANIAETAFLGIDACFPDSVVGFTEFRCIVDSKYIYYFINAFREQIEAYAPATAQKNINLKILEELIVPYCSLEEQKRIVRLLEKHFSVIDHLTQAIDSALARAELLRQSILKKAFSGKLVPQAPNDEPASELLKRIKAEREKAKTEGRKVKRTRRRRK